MRAPVPPFTDETARQKVQAAEDAWNTRDPQRVAGGRVGLDLDVLVLPLGADGLFGGHQLDGSGDLLVRAGADVDDGDLFVQDEGCW